MRMKKTILNTQVHKKIHSIILISVADFKKNVARCKKNFPEYTVWTRKFKKVQAKKKLVK